MGWQAFHQVGSSGPRGDVLGMCLIRKKWRENSVELKPKRDTGDREGGRGGGGGETAKT